MEKANLISHGVNKMLECLYTTHSDGFVAHVCDNCKQYSQYNKDIDAYSCQACKSESVIVKTTQLYTTKQLFLLYELLGIKTELHVGKDLY